MSDILYKFTTGKITLFIEEDGEYGTWYYIYQGNMYKTYVTEYYTTVVKPNDREILRIYNSYHRSAQLELSKIISLFPSMEQDQSFMGFKKQGKKYFFRNSVFKEGTFVGKDHMIQLLLEYWYEHVNEWKDRKKFLIKDNENKEWEEMEE